MTVGNGEGAYFADEATLDLVGGRRQGGLSLAASESQRLVRRHRRTPRRRYVLGYMPHPDRAFEAALGSADGALLFQSVLGAA